MAATVPALALVHNGVIENYKSLKAVLESEGYVFQSETDTEVVRPLDCRLPGAPNH